MSRKSTDHTGSVFNKLTVIGKTKSDKNGQSYWRCVCECGKEIETRSSSLINGHTKSCGCLKSDFAASSARAIKHGRSRTPVYNIWKCIKARCNKPSHDAFERYGGRGITICERWENSFDNFLSDMGERPSSSHSIDRINNDIGYNKDNCRWATRIEQSRNTSKNVFIEHNGKRMCVVEWSELLGINSSTICNRLRKGWSVEKALS